MPRCVIREKMDVKQYSETLLGKPVHFYILTMNQSHFVWIGDAPKLSEIAVAMKNRHNSSVVSTQLLGASSSVTSAGVAEKLARKLPNAAQFFVSCTINDPLLLSQVEMWLIKHFQQLYTD